ncbi:substrate-binding domain-containing protein [Anaerobium acetethylicum]|uniref:Ribose transport system substrate-binding protein n=1 Tax=Anaerobium acetethylicum TaxID=1619234 RepID=A0A1D3TWL1_9FIRM|nr:substrate-binding domain-containing protein [Anaerobium acetethylicum]SCP98619.1 ribose transport system substrate-binding protein [Anaerobium acetethylicum]
MMKRKLAMVMAAVMTIGLLVGCGSKTTENASTDTAGATAEVEASDSAGKGGKTFGITYWIESDFFKTVADSITEQAEADGNKTVVVDAQQDSTKQIQIIEDFIAQGVDAVFLNPVDRDAIEPALQKLDEAGIPVINFDSAVANLDLVDAYVATDNKLAGVLCAEAMIADLPEGGDIAVLNYPANSACIDREAGFLETIEGKGFNIVATFDAEGTVEKGQNITSDILQAHPDIVAIFSINDQAGMGAYAALTTTGTKANIYGVDGAPEAKQVIAKNGIYKMTAAQSPIKIGVECYKAAQTLAAGKELDNFQINVPAFSIDQTNIKEYLSEGWQ